MTKYHHKNSEERPNISQLPHLTHPTSQIELQDDPYQLHDDNEIMTKSNITNSEENHFNKLLITLLNGQKRPTKPSLNLMQDITHRHVNDNLIRYSHIWQKKYGTSRLAATDWKSSFIDP